MQRVLGGVRVVEMAEGVAGSYCAKLFGDLGADVVKVEGPGGDPIRGASEGSRSSVGGAFLHLNTNKRSVVIDPDAPGATDRVWRLLESADLVVEVSGAGDLATYGLSWGHVHERLPALVVVSISGFGATGPYAAYKWSDLTVQAMSGALLLQHSDQQDPVKLPARVALYFVGSMAAVGGLGALLWARSSGDGRFVDCAAVEALASVPARATILLAFQYRGGEDGPGFTSSSGETLIPTGVFPCADGYMAMMSTPQQLGEMLQVLDSDELRAAFAMPDAFQRGDTKEAIDAALYPWLLSHTRAEATAEAQAVGWPLAGVNLPEEVLGADHLHQRNFWVHMDHPVAGSVDLPGPGTRYAEGGWAVRRIAPARGQADAEPFEAATPSSAPAAGDGGVRAGDVLTRPRGFPLEGIRVLDMTTVWAGPYATMLLADLGAEVIRVENPFVLPPTTKGYQARPAFTDNLGYLGSGYGPTAPGRPDRPWNRHSLNNSISRNKLSCTIDTRRPEGRQLLMRLVEQCDVFVENFKASGLNRMGISVSEMQSRHPGLVVVRMPPAGTTGDWSSYAGFGAQFDGLTGFLSLCGHRGSDLTTSPATTYMDAASGPAGALAAMAGLRYRAATGRGQLIEMTQSENVINHLGDVYVDYQLGVTPPRLGNRDPERAPQGLYRCGDGKWLAVSVGDDQEWARLAALISGPDPLDDPRYRHVAGRQAHHDDLDALLSSWAAARHAVDAFHELQRHSVPAAPLLDDRMFCDDPHVKARGWLQPLTTTDVGTHLHAGLPYRGVPLVWRRGSPGLGEDNDYVFTKILGVSDEELDHYRKARIVAEDYLSPEGMPL
jgi:crotonobetainyl-CoA:carnitine CoA-transferase CaiB-like acyl-CoA transferase